MSGNLSKRPVNAMESDVRLLYDKLDTETTERKAADNTERENRKEDIAKIENVHKESGLVEYIKKQAVLYISTSLTMGVNLIELPGGSTVAYPIFSGDSGDLKIDDTDVDISNVEMVPLDAFDFADMDYTYIGLSVHGTMMENQYRVTKVVLTFDSVSSTFLDPQNGVFALPLCTLQKIETPEGVIQNITVEIYERNVENEIEFTGASIHVIADKKALEKEIADRQTSDGELQTAINTITADVAAVSNNTKVIQNNNGGFMAGSNAWTAYGGAIGRGAHTSHGGAAGDGAYAGQGGAVGAGAKAGNGFSGGSEAKVSGDAESGYIDAIQLGGGTNNNQKTLQVYDYQLMDAGGQIPDERILGIRGDLSTIQHTVSQHSDDISQLGSRVDGLDETVTGLDMTLADVTSNLTLIENATNGGFAAGTNASLTDNDCYGTGGAAVGKQASANGGLAGGGMATTCCGFSGGYETWSDGGGAGGAKAYTYDGGTLGQEAYSDDGGAIGCDAKAGNGFSGGNMAQVANVDGTYIDAIQLGSGTNNDADTLQVYSYQLMDANGRVPKERLQNEYGGFAAGDGAVTPYAPECTGSGGVAIGKNAQANGGLAGGEESYACCGLAGGYKAVSDDGCAGGVEARTGDGGSAGMGTYSEDGGAVGMYAKAGNGFSGGVEAQVANTGSDEYPWYIDAIQLGQGTNNDEYTLQVYSYQLMDANGQIPAERLTDVYDAINALQTAVANLQN